MTREITVVSTKATEFHPSFVVPRYGEEIVGGAENLARRTAEELAARGLTVSVLTTCAVDHHTWRNVHPQGESRLNGVRIFRFPAETSLGDPGIGATLAKIASGARLSEKDQIRWFRGVVTSERLFEHIEENRSGYTHFIFLPYLFGTTYFGSEIYPEKSYIVPCLHDEPYAHQSLVVKMLSRVKGLIFNSYQERRLAGRLLGEDDPGEVVGMGFRRSPGDPAAFFNRTPVRGDFILCAGRREEGKNTPLLVEYFRAFALQNPNAASLALIGSGDVRIPRDAAGAIFDLGRVSEKQKQDGYAASYAFCQPSVNESLSIVLLESWLAGKPALVHRKCDVTREHVERSGGGLCFSDYPEFAESLLFLLEDGDRASRIGLAGRRYVEEEYNWEKVLERLFRALEVETG